MRVAVAIVLVALVATFGVLFNVLFFGIRVMLKHKGLKVRWFGLHEIGLLREAIANENDPSTKMRYRKHLYAYLASIALFLLSGLLLMLVLN
jgi:hypothetical protein